MSRDAALSVDLPWMDPAALRGFERVAVPLLTWVNRSRTTKRAIWWFLRLVTYTWIHLAMRRRLHVHGLENLRDLSREHGLLLVANHRSFFDMYVATVALHREIGGVELLYFPVRARYFYTHPIGLLVNLAISGGAMWPPIFSESGRARLNATGLAQVAHVLGEPGTVVGLHPEGTRNKRENPYDLLPAKSGVGRIAQQCHPDARIVPFFLSGLSNDFLREIGGTFWPRRLPDLHLRFGAPIRAGDLDPKATPAHVARDLLDVVRALGEQDREQRAADGTLAQVWPQAGNVTSAPAVDGAGGRE